MGKRLLLINPPYDIGRYMGGLGKIGWVFPPVGLLYLASYIRKSLPSFEVSIFDFQVDGRDFDVFLKDFRPDIAGITCQTALVYSTLAIAKKIKSALPDTMVVSGGVHASIRPQDLLESGDVDFVVRGEGEETLLELCRFADDKKRMRSVRGVSYKDEKGGVSGTPGMPLSPDLDKYPMPALDLIPLDKYRISPDLRTGSKFALLLSARGCPYDCIFCANKLLTERTYRARPIKSVIEEIEYYLSEYGMTQLMIIDDNFTVNRKRTLELCDEFIKRGYPSKFNWWAEGRVDSLDEELLGRMKKAGCSILSLGLESGNQRLLDLIGKKITLDQTRQAVGMISRSGIKSRASVILGLPTETRQESLNSIRFAYSLPLDQVRFSVATPFPGTKLWDIAVQEGRIDPGNVNWLDLSLMGGYAGHELPYYPLGRSSGEIKALQRRANLMFYLRPRVIFGFLGRIRSFSDIIVMFGGAVQFFKSSMGGRRKAA